jgi:hypothetical protein
MIKTRDNPLAVWGKNDPSFVPAGAQAFSRDNPEAQIHFATCSPAQVRIRSTGRVWLDGPPPGRERS